MADQKFNIRSGFYNSVAGDRLYDADDMGMPYKRIITEGVYLSSGHDDSWGLTNTDTMDIVLATGGALLAGKWIDMTEAVTITVPENNTAYDRIDTLMIQVDTRQDGRKASVVYRTGTPSATPEAPAINQVAGCYEFPLWDVLVEHGVTTLYLDKFTSRMTWADVVIDQPKFDTVNARLDALETAGARTNLNQTTFINSVSNATINDFYATVRSNWVNVSIAFEKTGNLAIIQQKAKYAPIDGAYFPVIADADHKAYIAQQVAQGIAIYSDVPNNATYFLLMSYPLYN